MTSHPKDLSDELIAAYGELGEEGLWKNLEKFLKKIIKWLDKKLQGGWMNDEEVDLAAKHPLAAVDVYIAKETACTITRGIFGDNWNSDDTKANAFAHREVRFV